MPVAPVPPVYPSLRRIKMLVTYNTIKAAENARQPWTHRLVFKGWDAKRARHSDKWWTISGDGSGSVAVNFGRAGSNGRTNPFRYSLREGLKRLNDKRSKGYDVAPGHTAFREVPAERPLEGPYAAIRRIAFRKKPAGSLQRDSDGVLMYEAQDAEGVCITALTPKSAARLLARSALIRSNTPPPVIFRVNRDSA